MDNDDPANDPPHLFITLSDVRSIACDAWIMPTSRVGPRSSMVEYWLEPTTKATGLDRLSLKWEVPGLDMPAVCLPRWRVSSFHLDCVFLHTHTHSLSLAFSLFPFVAHYASRDCLSARLTLSKTDDMLNRRICFIVTQRIALLGVCIVDC